MMSGPGKVVKIWPNFFTAVLTRNGKNCTQNNVGTFRVQKKSSEPRFQLCLLLACSGGIRAGKSLQNLTETFLLTENDKNGTPNGVRMSQVQNRVIQGPFSTLPGLVVPGPEKSSKFDQNIFQAYWRETIRTALQIVWVCFRCKIESFGLDFQLCLLWWRSGPEKSSKFDQNIFQP